MFTIASRKSLSAALVAGALAIGLVAASAPAEARPRGGHGHHGHHGGHGFHGGWGWGWGHGMRGPRRFAAYGYGYGGCFLQRRYDEYGYYIGRVRVCR